MYYEIVRLVYANAIPLLIVQPMPIPSMLCRWFPFLATPSSPVSRYKRNFSRDIWLYIHKLCDVQTRYFVEKALGLSDGVTFQRSISPQVRDVVEQHSKQTIANNLTLRSPRILIIHPGRGPGDGRVMYSFHYQFYYGAGWKKQQKGRWIPDVSALGGNYDTFTMEVHASFRDPARPFLLRWDCLRGQQNYFYESIVIHDPREILAALDYSHSFHKMPCRLYVHYKCHECPDTKYMCCTITYTDDDRLTLYYSGYVWSRETSGLKDFNNVNSMHEAGIWIAHGTGYDAIAIVCNQHPWRRIMGV